MTYTKSYCCLYECVSGTDWHPNSQILYATIINALSVHGCIYEGTCICRSLPWLYKSVQWAKESVVQDPEAFSQIYPWSSTFCQNSVYTIRTFWAKYSWRTPPTAQWSWQVWNLQNLQLLLQVAKCTAVFSFSCLFASLTIFVFTSTCWRRTSWMPLTK